MIIRILSLKTIIFIVILLMPLTLSVISLSRPITIKDIYCKEQSEYSILVAGDFRYFNVTLNVDAENICIIAYHGKSRPNIDDRYIGNYYRWEYNHGIWKDNSGHNSLYIKPSWCIKNNYTYSFYIKIDSRAKPGCWTVNILIDDEEVEQSNNSFVVVAQFNLFLSALIGVFEPINNDKKSIDDIELICSERKKIMIESKENINNLVDKVLRKQATSDQEVNSEEIDIICFSDKKPHIEDESVKLTISTYHKSKLKIKNIKAVNFLYFSKKWGEGKGSSSNISIGYRRFLTIMLAIILLSVVFFPIINTQDNVSSSKPIITSFNIFPDKVILNSSLLLNVSATSSKGIKSVIADIGDIETINLTFIEGTIVNDTFYSGLWQSTWLVQNIDPGDYIVKIFAFNNQNESVSQQGFFTVLQLPNNEVNIFNNSSLAYEFNEFNDITHTDQQNTTIPNKNETDQSEMLNKTDARDIINNSLKPEFNESSNINWKEEHNNTIQINNDTIQIELLNNTNNSIYNSTHSELYSSNISMELSTNITTDNLLYVNQTNSNISNESAVFIVDKRHEELSVLPGTRFCVERTIDGPHGTNVVFVPMFSDALTLESIEIVEDKVKNLEKNFYSTYNSNSYFFEKGEARSKRVQEIEQLREKLPDKIKALNKIAYTDNVELQSPRTIRLWFRAPSWDELQNGIDLSSGEISYLVFSDDDNINFDFEGSTWWNSNWNYRKLITVNSSQVENDLKNFPILVSVTDIDLASKAQDDGDDIAFVLNSDSTTLNHEIENYNSTTGELVAWVNVTSLSSSTDTLIWMYYNNSDCGSQENIAGTWDSNYVAVWHFNNNSLDDSTSHGYDGVNSGTSYNSNCKIAGGREYNGDEWININNFYTISTSLTAETWVYRDLSDSQNFIRFFTEGPDWNDNDWCLYWRIGASNVRFVINSDDYSTGGSFAFSGEWFHTAITYDTGDAYLFKNGALDADWTGNYGVSINNIYDTLTIGNQNGGGRDWIGRMDEVRISNIRRSAAWIGTTYNTTNFPDTFLSFDIEQNVTNTSVDTISPYNITYSPLTITATGASGLDNVTLWYRFSIDNSSWDDWLEDIIDTISPWKWSFSFPNGTGYYEFYSIGKKSGLPDESAPSIADTACYVNTSINTPPTIEIVNPAPNGTSDVNRQPTCQIWANDSDGDTLTVYWYENTTGPWILQQTNNSVSANSIVFWNYTQANNYGTIYWWKVAVNDSQDNTTAIYYFTTETIKTSVDTIIPYIVTGSIFNISATGSSDLDNITLYYRWSEHNFTEWDALTYDDFEGVGFDWGNFTDGGVDCLEYTGGIFAHQGSNAANIQDNSGVGSSFYHSSGIDVDSPGYEYIKVDFWFRGEGMEDSEDIWVRYFDGTSWITVATYVAGTDFVNGQFYHEIVWINESDYTFPSNMQIRFQCDASSDFDDIYIDEIYVNATTAVGDSTDWAIWSDSSNPDNVYPWNWSFDFSNGVGYYEFYSIGNKSGSPDETSPPTADAICYYNPNPAPIIQVINPTNGAINVSIQPTCQIRANDGNGDLLTVYWYEYTTESWVLRQTNSSVPANSTVNWTYTQADAYGITYWWKVAVNDSVSNTSAIYYFITKYLNSSIDAISPYIQTYSPLNISATGNSDLSNITLFYRWSENNFTWTTLTYDDFEAAGFEWGNFTDGGVDCLEYTGGIFAHQGSNAANIQDDSSVSSSFYHTSGIDVDSPGYEYIKVDFWFRGEEMEAGEDFWVRYFDGTSWITVATYVAGTDFVNGQFYHEIVWINESDYTFPSNMQIRFQCDASSDLDDIYIDEIYVNTTTTLGNYTGWKIWNNNSNPDETYPWNWDFDFPYSTGYYEFYSIAKKSGSADELPPAIADAKCYFYSGLAPIINNYDLRNITGSKLNNVTGCLDVNSEYYFTINITEPNGWYEISYINITAWYDNGDDNTTYNQTQGGNLNMFLQYENITGIANFTMLWPDDEAQLMITNCTETIIDTTTRLINISFKPLSQIRWASSNYTWNSTGNAYNDPYSWNFNISVVDSTNRETWKINEYGVYKYTSHSLNQNWVDVYAAPGFSDTSSVVTITYSSNYNFNMSIYFEDNLYNSTWDVTILIQNNVEILAGADPNDDITTDITFSGIGEANAVDIFNDSGIFPINNVSQTVNVQFDVYIPLGTLGVKYKARVATKVVQD